MRLFYAMLAPLLWGTCYATISAYFRDWSPFVLATWRALPAGILLLLIKPTLPKIHELPAIALVAFINIALFFTLLFKSALKLPSSLVGVAMLALPVVGLFFMLTVYKVKPSRVQLGSSAILITSCAYLFQSSASPISVDSVIYLISAMVVLIFGSIISNRVMKKINWWKLVTWQLILGGLFLLPLAYFNFQLSGKGYANPFVFDSIGQMLALGWLIIGVTSISYAVYFYSIPLVTTSELSFCGTLNPMLAMFLGVTLMGDNLNSLQLLIMLIMVISNISTQYYQYRKAKTNQATALVTAESTSNL
ncbi:DMT family transporter [Vibrio panuliri]|uniref:EamA domain-containing protein n=1 Tax=Vibrio panuliri TaxID=1381081 RepID=A0ABX3FS43_9VIBR|nr:EamA family transporter [Vibrio panuliri]KAB1457063.1 EamA family transporter [Vibrio panuliri]OLQ95668.1 hypothetical protein BIY20_20890 [Vibrio panuliri]